MRTPPRPELSVVVPVKDEADNLEDLVREIHAALDAIGRPYEVLLVDDGSRDGSRERIRQLAFADARVRGLLLDGHHGQTAAFLAGFARVRGDVAITMDADLQNDPRDVARLLDALASADLAIGVRVGRKDDLLRRISSRVANAARRAVTGDGVRDTGCSLKAFRREVLGDFPPLQGMHRFFPALARMHGRVVVEVEVSHRPRRAGRSKYGILDRLGRGVVDLAGVWWLRRRLLAYRVVEESSSAAEDPVAEVAEVG